MTEVAFARDTLVTFGAGIAALLLVFGTAALFLIKAPKFFKAWQEMVRASDIERQLQLKAITELNATTVEVIRANTAAFEQSDKTTENMTKALELLSAMFERSTVEAREHDARYREHDARVLQMSLVISQISERTSACRTRWEDKR